MKKSRIIRITRIGVKQRQGHRVKKKIIMCSQDRWEKTMEKKKKLLPITNVFELKEREKERKLLT